MSHPCLFPPLWACSRWNEQGLAAVAVVPAQWEAWNHAKLDALPGGWGGRSYSWPCHKKTGRQRPATREAHSARPAAVHWTPPCLPLPFSWQLGYRTRPILHNVFFRNSYVLPSVILLNSEISPSGLHFFPASSRCPYFQTLSTKQFLSHQFL